MRDGRSGETKCVPETNLITPAMGQNSLHPHPLLHGNTHSFWLPPRLPILPVYCVQVEAGGSALRPSPWQLWKYVRHDVLRRAHSTAQQSLQKLGGGRQPEPRAQFTNGLLHPNTQ